MGKYFGTDGFRGEANVNLTADHAYKIGRFLGWYFGELKRQRGIDANAKIVIGKDTRRSSYMFEYSLVGGLVASGADAYLLHVTTTPSVAYVARIDDFDCGIMISASHNPYYDNGIKIINGNGCCRHIADFTNDVLNMSNEQTYLYPCMINDKVLDVSFLNSGDHVANVIYYEGIPYVYDEWSNSLLRFISDRIAFLPGSNSYMNFIPYLLSTYYGFSNEEINL